jgi:hypothetical protein
VRWIDKQKDEPFFSENRDFPADSGDFIEVNPIDTRFKPF